MSIWAILALTLLGACECSGTALTLVDVEPSTGPTAGGTPVRVHGSGFEDGMEVLFGAAPATEVVVVSSLVADVVTPPGTEGVADVSVTRRGEVFLLADAYTYRDGPLLMSILPNSGPTDGGQSVIVDGSGFVDGTTLFIGGLEALEVIVMGDTMLQARTPRGALGLAEVMAMNPDGQTATLEDGYEFTESGRCGVTAVDPTFGEIDVAVSRGMRVEWSTRIVDGTGAVELRTLEGSTVDATVAMDGDRAVTITPTASLHFWSSYALVVAPTDAIEGVLCDGESVAFTTVVPRTMPRDLRPASARMVARSGDHLLVASPSYRGLQVYDVSDLSAVDLVGELETDAEAWHVSVLGDRAYVAMGWAGVLIVNISDPTTPLALDVAGTPGFARESQPFDQGGANYLAVADMSEGARILDVTDPEAVRTAAVFDPSGARAAQVTSVTVDGGRLGVVNGTLGYLVLDITDPSAPVVTAQSSGSGELALQMLFDGDVIYVVLGSGGIVATDATVGTLPELNRLSADTAMRDFFWHAARDGRDLYVAAARGGLLHVTVDGAGSLDLSSRRSTPSPALSVAMDPDGLTVGEQGGVVTLDRTGGTSPLWFDEEGHGFARSLSVVGDRAFVAAGGRGLQEFGLMAPSSPMLTARTDTPGSRSQDVAAWSVISDGTSTVLGDGRAGVVLYDTSVPGELTELGTSTPMDRNRGVARQGDIVFSCEDNQGVAFIDVSDESAPVLLARETFPSEVEDQCLALALHGEHLYVGGRLGLTVLDVGDPRSPGTAGRFDLRAQDSIVALEVADGVLVASTRVSEFEATNGTSHRLQLFELTDPGTPNRVFISEDLGGIAQARVVGDVLFLAAADVGVLVFDVSDLREPVLEGTIRTPGNALDVAATSDRLYVAQSEGGIGVIEVGLLPDR